MEDYTSFVAMAPDDCRAYLLMLIAQEVNRPWSLFASSEYVLGADLREPSLAVTWSM